VDRDRNKVVDIRVSRKRSKFVFFSMARWLEKQGYKVRIMCTDGYTGYCFYKISDRHVVSKAETSLVESKNSLIRHYLARFNRKTKRYSKTLDMIFHSLMVFFYKTLLLSIII